MRGKELIELLGVGIVVIGVGARVGAVGLDGDVGSGVHGCVLRELVFDGDPPADLMIVGDARLTRDFGAVEPQCDGGP